MKPDDVVVGVVTGCALIVFALVPGLFHGLTEGVRNFANSMFSPFATGPAPETGYENAHGPLWLAGLGIALIMLSVLGYIWQ